MGCSAFILQHCQHQANENLRCNKPPTQFAAGPPVRAPQVTRSRFARADPDEPTATPERQDGGSALQQLRLRLRMTVLLASI